MLPGLMLVLGQPVDSKEEYFVSISLIKYGWVFDYQVPFFGGKNKSGGFVMDFIVHTVPKFTPLQVNGEYWHSGAQADRDKLNDALLHSRLRGQYMETVTLWGSQLTDQDETDKAILEKVGRNN